MLVERYPRSCTWSRTCAAAPGPGLQPLDIVRACFPAGTVSGAPKVRAMEIIEHLEPVRRGVYAGAVGHFDYHGNLDLAIAIRTLVYQGGTAHWGVGAGIVADSVPEQEWEETIAKGRALWLALQRAERGVDAGVPEVIERCGNVDRGHRIRFLHLQPGPVPGDAGRHDRGVPQ
jgi:anthranilate synthase component 1